MQIVFFYFVHPAANITTSHRTKTCALLLLFLVPFCKRLYFIMLVSIHMLDTVSHRCWLLAFVDLNHAQQPSDDRLVADKKAASSL